MDNHFEKSVHQGAMQIKRSVDDAYHLAIQDGFALLDVAIDEPRLRKALIDDRSGAVVSFDGRVRNHNNDSQVQRLTYYGYEALAINQGRLIIDKAKAQFGIVNAVAMHRIGALEIGDMAIWVGVSAAHRDAAFDACRWILDTIKADIPIWKQEYYPDEPSKWLSNNG
ncbi:MULTISPECIES: molybdenum cofactor biosynthesis protein MoaE [Psychrobacter]|uniref:molybdenum cofactor biosynthesis protein MoaE n=1 Tax=Psychrobacter TaxID=497 RepID=UPI00146E306D|nr:MULTISPECIES: molybdenum cofactor biosynthesis protein MoaE [Psychrobacter]